MAKTKTNKPTKADKVIFDAYQIAINNKLKAGKDVSRMTNRLQELLTEYKKQIFHAGLGLFFLSPNPANFNRK